MKIPESLHFLRPGWWLLHVVSVSAVFMGGFVTSSHLSEHKAHAHHAKSAAHHDAHDKPSAQETKQAHEAHEAHEAHDAHDAHDHTAPAVLKPLMRQMLVNTIQLQGSLKRGDLKEAAAQADAIAGACEDSDETQDELKQKALPDRLGPSFIKHDRELHQRASELATALRQGHSASALSLQKALISSCQSCHAQAPAASAIDLGALTTYSDTLLSTQGEAP